MKLIKVFNDLFNDYRNWDGAASLSFYFIFSLFPAMLVFLTTLSLLQIDELPYEVIQLWVNYLPGDMRKTVLNIIDKTRSESSMSIISAGFVFALWTAVSGVNAIIRQLNHSYGIKETRSFIRLKTISFLITCLFGCLFVLSFFLVIFGRNIVNFLTSEFHLPYIYTVSLSLFRYLLFLFILILFFSVLYNFGPNLKNKRYKVLNIGSLLASAAFLLTTNLFSFYLSYVNDYSIVYGSLGTIIGMMMWFYILGYIIIVGAHFNSYRIKKDGHSS